MANEEDPFELLKRKLQAKKAQGRPAAKRPAPPRPSRPAPAQKRGSSGSDAPPRSGKPAPFKRVRAKDPGAGKLRIIRTAWAKEDLERMRNSTESTREGPPGG